MGQGEVLQAIEERGFTTLQELHEDLELTISSITQSLSQLTKWHEVEFIIMKQQRRVYFDLELIGFLTGVCEDE